MRRILSCLGMVTLSSLQCLFTNELLSSGNGGTQAIEDAISLAACVAVAGKGEIPNATRVHNLLRSERVSCLQALGVANREARIGKNVNKDNMTTHNRVGKWFVEYAVPERESYLTAS